MNILILNWRDPKNPKSGGAEIVTMQHARAWIHAGHRVTWFTSTYPGLLHTETIDGVHIIREGNNITVFIRALFFYFRNREIFDLIIDEIHGIPFFTPLYVKKPILAYIHEVAGPIWDYMFPFPISSIGKILENLMFMVYKNTPFMTVSPSTEYLLKNHGIRTISVILNGLDTTYSKGVGQKEKYPTFIFVGRLVKMKGIEEVIKAFEFICQKLPTACLWIVGDGEKTYTQYLKQLTKQIHVDQKVQFWGRVDEKEKNTLLRKAHLLLHASVREGWGLVVIEAASQGTPAVVYNTDGLRDSVKDNKTGIVLNTNTPEELSNKAITLYTNKKLYTFMQKNCLVWSKQLSWSESTKKSTKLIEKLSKQ